MTLSTATKAEVRALLARHNIRLDARDLDGDKAIELLDFFGLPGTYATGLAAQRRLLMVLADEVAATDADPARRLKDHAGKLRLSGVTRPKTSWRPGSGKTHQQVRSSREQPGG